jgi:hypothetical protein
MRLRAARTRAQTPALLKGLIFGPTGRAMTPTHTRKNGRLYRYYVSTDVLKRDPNACTVKRVPAAEIESAVIEQVRGLLRSPEIIVRTWRAARQSLEGLSEGDVREALKRLDPFGMNCSRPSRRGSSSFWSTGSTSLRTAPTSDCEMKG